MKGRQPRIHAAFRIAAGMVVVFWLGTVALCNVESALGWDNCSLDEQAEVSANQATASHDHHDPSHNADHDAGGRHAPDAEGHSHGSHHHDGGEGSCCSTLQSVVQTAPSIVLGKPALQPLTFLPVLLGEAHNLTLLAQETVPGRPTKCCEWVFTPEVCLGPAFRSHAPPIFI